MVYVGVRMDYSVCAIMAWKESVEMRDFICFLTI